MRTLAPCRSCASSSCTSLSDLADTCSDHARRRGARGGSGTATAGGGSVPRDHVITSQLSVTSHSAESVISARGAAATAAAWGGDGRRLTALCSAELQASSTAYGTHDGCTCMPSPVSATPWPRPSPRVRSATGQPAHVQAACASTERAAGRSMQEERGLEPWFRCYRTTPILKKLYLI